MKNILKRFKSTDNENINLIRNNKLFDESYYMSENPDVKMDPARHYYYYGFKEGKSPSFYFSNDYYLENYDDVKKSGINPLIHYIKFGKQENRLISKDNGLNIQTFYYNKVGYNYSFNINFVNEDSKKINFFLDKIDDSIGSYLEIIKYVFKYARNNAYTLRIIYNSSDLSYLKDLINKYKLNLPYDVEFLNLKNDYYLFVSNNDKFICTSYKSTLALLRTSNLNTTIYYYFDGYKDDLEINYNISKIINNPNVICLSSSSFLDTYKYSLEYKVVKKLKIGNLYCQSDEALMIMVELLNKLFLNEILKNNSWNLYFVNNDIKFHLDSDVRIHNISSLTKNNCFFSINNKLDSDVAICAKIKKEKSKVKIHDISNNDFKLLNLRKKIIPVEDQDYIDFVQAIKKALGD